MIKINFVGVFLIIGLQLITFDEVIGQTYITGKVGFHLTNAKYKNTSKDRFDYEVNRMLNSGALGEIGLERKINELINLSLSISYQKNKIASSLDISGVIIDDMAELEFLSYNYFTINPFVSYQFRNWMAIGAGPYLGFIRNSKLHEIGGWIGEGKRDAYVDRRDLGVRTSVIFKYQNLQLEIGFQKGLIINDNFEGNSKYEEFFALRPTNAIVVAIGYSFKIKS